MSRALCRTCKAAVIWATTERGESMPVDAAPVRGGTFRLEGAAARPTAVHAEPLLESDEQRAAPHYVSHFATCPQAAQHRRTRR